MILQYFVSVFKDIIPTWLTLGKVTANGKAHSICHRISIMSGLLWYGFACRSGCAQSYSPLPLAGQGNSDRCLQTGSSWGVVLVFLFGYTVYFAGLIFFSFLLQDVQQRSGKGSCFCACTAYRLTGVMGVRGLKWKNEGYWERCEHFLPLGQNIYKRGCEKCHVKRIMRICLSEHLLTAYYCLWLTMHMDLLKQVTCISSSSITLQHWGKDVIIKRHLHHWKGIWEADFTMNPSCSQTSHPINEYSK